MDDEEITQKFAARRPYDKWIKENLVTLDDLVKSMDHAARQLWPMVIADGQRRASPPATATIRH